MYDDQLLQLFTSSLFLAGLFMSFFAARITRVYGRKATMLFASLCFLAGTGLNAGAVSLWMLVLGRILLGFGIGAANTAVPLYLSETAPHKYRGALNMMFQLAVTIGILAAQVRGHGGAAAAPPLPPPPPQCPTLASSPSCRLTPPNPTNPTLPALSSSTTAPLRSPGAGA